MPEWVELIDPEGKRDYVIIDAVPFSYHRNFEHLLGVIQGTKLPPAVLDSLIQKIINLHPRLDAPGIFGFDTSLLPSSETARLFEGSALLALNRAVVDDDDDEPDPAYIPPWSSGDTYDDWTADLIVSLQSFSEADRLMRSRSVQSIQNIRRRLADHHLGNEGREKRDALKWALTDPGSLQLEAQVMRDYMDGLNG